MPRVHHRHRLVAHATQRLAEKMRRSPGVRGRTQTQIRRSRRNRNVFAARLEVHLPDGNLFAREIQYRPGEIRLDFFGQRQRLVDL